VFLVPCLSELLAARALFFFSCFFSHHTNTELPSELLFCLSLSLFSFFFPVTFEPASSSSSQSAVSEMVILTAVGDEAAAQTWS
jgi:hypothetical protein